MQPLHTCTVIGQAKLDRVAHADSPRNGSAWDAATVMLRIVRYANDAGFHLLRLDAAGDELPDTFHQSVEAACAQTALEFRTKPGERRDASAI